MKIGQLYDIDSVVTFKDSRKFQDNSYAGVVLARNLEQIDPTWYEKQFPDLAFLLSGIDVDNTGGFAERIRSRRRRPQGTFRNAGDSADNKGKITIAGETSFINVIEREAESKWTDTEIRQSELEGVNLPGEFVRYHNEIYLREIDEMGLIGFNGNEGLLTYSGFTSTAASGAIATLTPQQMYDEYATLITEQWNGVNNTAAYKGMVVETPVYAINTLNATILNSAGGQNAMSVMQALMANFPGVKFLGTFRADDAISPGVSATVVHSVNRESMLMRVPEPLRIGEIVKLGSFDFKVDSKYRVGGLDVLENTAGRRLTGL